MSFNFFLLFLWGFIYAHTTGQGECNPTHSEQVNAFFDHVQKFNIGFRDGVEFSKRFSVFSANFERVVHHNCFNNATFKYGVNKFSHLTSAEFRDAVKRGGTRVSSSVQRKSGKHVSEITVPAHIASETLATLPPSIDWEAFGAVTPVQDQGNCGSCYAFSAIGAIEGAYYIKYNSNTSLSTQQIVSCDSIDFGCNGGSMVDVFEWAQLNNALTTDSLYPYTSGTTGLSGACLGNFTQIRLAVPTTYTWVEPNSVGALMAAVAQQPVSITIEVDQDFFQFYAGGVISNITCGQNANHGVLLVGYGTVPLSEPSAMPSPYSSSTPSIAPSAKPSVKPTSCPTRALPKSGPTVRPSVTPSAKPTPMPTTKPSRKPTPVPSPQPTFQSSAGLSYWRIKNSWGKSWGIQGYALILQSSLNLCGVLTAPIYPNL